MTQEKTTIEPQPSLIPRYLLWTFAISWGFWGLAILLLKLGAPFLLAFFSGLPGVYGPPIAACVVLQKSWKDIPKFFFSHSKKIWIPLLILIGIMFVSYLLMSDGWNPDVTIGAIFLNLIYTLIQGGGPEEPGWRGFLQPALEKKFSFPIATVIVGVIWTVWHLPFWLVPGWGPSSSPLLEYLISTVMLSFAFAGLYKYTKSVLACILFHSAYNVITGGFLTGGSQFPDLLATLLMGLFGCYLWYQTDRREKAQAKIASKS